MSKLHHFALRDVSVEDIDASNVRCPRCASKTLTLSGISLVNRIETMEKGEITNVKIDESTHCFQLEFIDCLQCSTRYRIKTREVVGLERSLELLRERLISLTGEDPLGWGKPN
jgi:hypothetical protein